MENDNAVALAVVGLLGTVFAALFKLLNDNTKALNKVASSSEQVAKETAKGNREAKQRNGHLGEQNVQITRLIADQSKDLSAIRVSGEVNVVANKKAVELLQETAVTLKKNTELAVQGTKEVARVLKEADLGNQVVDQQTVVHQTVEHKEEVK